MSKYHVSKSGAPAVCHATIKGCPLGEHAPHGEFDSPGEARAWAEAVLASEYGGSFAATPSLEDLDAAVRERFGPGTGGAALFEENPITPRREGERAYGASVADAELLIAAAPTSQLAAELVLDLERRVREGLEDEYDSEDDDLAEKLRIRELLAQYRASTGTSSTSSGAAAPVDSSLAEVEDYGIEQRFMGGLAEVLIRENAVTAARGDRRYGISHEDVEWALREAPTSEFARSLIPMMEERVSEETLVEYGVEGDDPSEIARIRATLDRYRMDQGIRALEAAGLANFYTHGEEVPFVKNELVTDYAQKLNHEEGTWTQAFKVSLTTLRSFGFSKRQAHHTLAALAYADPAESRWDDERGVLIVQGEL